MKNYFIIFGLITVLILSTVYCIEVEKNRSTHSFEVPAFNWEER